MNKKGAELPMNTLIAAIIAIVVLLLIITFFTGGLGTIGEKVRDIFGKGTAGYDVNIAKNFCTDYCSAAKRLVDANGAADAVAQSKSAYCTETFDIKQAGQLVSGIKCSASPISIACAGVTC